MGDVEAPEVPQKNDGVAPAADSKLSKAGKSRDKGRSRRFSTSSHGTASSGEFALEEFWKTPPAYEDIAHQDARSRAESTPTNRNSIQWLKTIMRGRSFAFIPILVSVVWSTLAVYISMLLKGRVAQEGCKWFCTPLGLDSNTHSYVGFALFLLLGFRVNESHQRYLDGLKIWTKIAGTIGSTSKYFLQAFPPGLFHQGDRERMLGWLVAFPVALKRELRNEKDLRELKHVLAPEDLAELQNAPNMASHTLYVLSAYIMKARTMERRFPQTFLVHLITWIADLAESADICTQIRRTPCAFSYVAHLRTFLLLWLFFLPFTLVESTSWGTPLIVAFITYGVVGVELNAAELENPFGTDFNDIPLGNLCDQIIDGVRETYVAAQAGSRRYVHSTGPVQPEEGDTFWLEGTLKKDAGTTPPLPSKTE